ncbi:monooxygenase [Lasiosphaeria hispida]|uniref:Monooxygenase n=1 Tax=Lasiosphaeria hispida TaxID=260671 RepID=A0AAJ0HFL4_9PEZI|nr:monooxygenase [Lasiosphaeria hispida]
MAPGETHVVSEYPEQVDLRSTLTSNPLPVIPPGTVDAASLGGGEATKIATAVIEKINAALAADDFEAFESCCFPSQTYWKDQVALTYHFRTFRNPGVVAANFLETKRLRGIPEGLRLEGTPQFVPATPVLQWIDCNFAFKTTSPAASASGRLLLLPHSNDGALGWKIWVLSTWLKGLDVRPHDESLLRSSGRQLESLDRIETDVLIIGGGNSGAVLAARLKALGVDSVILERNAQPGDNWALRYDYLQFHVPTSLCEMPYIPYPKHLHTPHMLTRDELASQVRLLISTFNLNLINSSTITSTTFSLTTKTWTIHFTTPLGPRFATAKHLVQATGIASQSPYTPPISHPDRYQGISLHSVSYKSAQSTLASHGAKSVIIVGSANTAFDILQDCAAVPSLRDITMVVRSPTYVVPVEYAFDPRGLGLYDHVPVSAADQMLMTLPTWVDGALAGGLFAMLAAAEPERYSKLKEAGFPVMDGTHPEVNLLHNLLERGGGHYVDVGGTKVLEEGRAVVKAGTQPVEYTEKGLRFEDGSVVEADAVVWCTGFADKNVRDVVFEVLGGHQGDGEERGEGVLGPRQIAERVDATFGVDAEGEIRGMWKRHTRLENYWVMGGHTGQQRWYSVPLVLQIQAALEGILPEAYREMKVPELGG